MQNEKLYVVSVISNPQKFKRRYELYYKYKKLMLVNEDVILYTVELAIGQRDFVITINKNCPICSDVQSCCFCDKCHSIRVRSNSELWHKENLINIGVAHLPEKWNYIAWIDADISFANTNWAKDTIEALQHHHVVQLFQNAIDLGPNDEFLNKFDGFAYKFRTVDIKLLNKNYQNWHPGYAWACTKYAWNSFGGLIEFAILGSADRSMVYSWIGLVEKSIPKGINKNYIEMLKAFQEKCNLSICRNIGYVNGTILHNFHGAKQNRQYGSRWQILVRNDFNPITDIKKNSQGILEFTGNKPNLIFEINKYFIQRNEDSIDL